MLRDNDNLVLELKRKHAALTATSHKVNSIYSTIISAFTLPLVIEAVVFKLFSENSPVIFSFMDISRRNKVKTDAMITEVNALLDKGGYVVDLRRIFLRYYKGRDFEQIYEIFIQEFDSLPVQEKLRSFLDNCCYDTLSSVLLKAENANIGKDLLEQEINKSYISFFHKMRSYLKMDQDVSTFSMDQQLFIKMNSERFDYCRELFGPSFEAQGIVNYIQYRLENINHELVRYEFVNSFSLFNFNISALKVAAVIAAKKIIVDRLVQLAFNNGLKPLPRFIEHKSRDELYNMFEELKIAEGILKSREKYSKNIARALSLMIFVLMAIEKNFKVNIWQALWLTSICTLVYGLFDAGVSMTNYIYNERNYRAKLAQNTLAFREMLDKSYTESVNSIDISNLSDSRVCIKFKTFKDLSGARVADIVNRILTSNNFGPIDAFENTLWISSKVKLSAFIARKVKVEIINSLNSKIEKRFVKQNKPLDDDLGFDDIEYNKSTSKKDKRIKPAVGNVGKIIVNNNNDNNAPAIPVWITPNANQATLIINSRGRNQFTLFRLQQNDFPNKSSFEKFRDTISDAPQVVRAVGAQGLVFSKKHGGTLKAKVLGIYGNFRVYASQKEVTADGNTLYVFDKLDLKAH